MNSALKRGWSSAICGTIAGGLLLVMAPLALSDDGDPQWSMGGQDLHNWRNQSKSKISAQNAAKLKVKWVFTTGGDVGATPAVVDGTVYFPDFAGNYYAVDAKTGTARWSRKVSDWTGIAGDFARNYPAVDGDMLILGDQAGNNAVWNGSQLTGSGARVIAVNRHTGHAIWVTQVDAFPATMVTSSPVVFNGIVYVGVASAEENLAANPAYPCCVSRGSLVALDQRTGRKLWQPTWCRTITASWTGTAAAASGIRRPSSTPNAMRSTSALATTIRSRQAVKACMLDPSQTDKKACT
jgi:polyvinyl alcohol dehydrogenase (cytochrome)